MKLAWDGEQDVEVTWTDAGSPDAPVVIVWPAFGTPATYYRHLTPALAEAGLATVVVEYPGRERRDGVGPHCAYGYDALAADVHGAVMRHVRARRPSAPVVLLGHSLGGHVALFAAARASWTDDVELRPDAIVLAATASPYWRGYGWRGVPRSLIGTSLMALVSRGVGYWPGDRLRFWGRQSRVLVEDWARLARTGRVLPRGARDDYEAALAGYDGAVLAISLPDDAFAPVPALENLLAMAPNADVTRWHSPVHLGHIQWVREHTEIVPIIADWVQARVSADVR